jgi:hypothetical protein
MTPDDALSQSSLPKGGREYGPVDRGQGLDAVQSKYLSVQKVGRSRLQVGCWKLE